MNLLKIIKAYWRGFVGGPDLHQSITRRFLLEGKQLSINIPDSNIVALPNADDKYYPHTSLTWFNEHAKIYDQHKYVHIYTKNWMYMPPIAIFPSSEYGMLSCQLRIKQVSHINVLDKAALSHYVTQAYDDYHNGPEGENTKIRTRIEERFKNSPYTWSQDEIEVEIAMVIDLHGNQPLAPAIIKNFNQTDWIFYSEVRNNRHSHNDFYCLPLSENSFLEVEFAHRIDLSHKYKKWVKHAIESQERIIASVYLDDLPYESSIEHSSVSKL